MAYRYYKMNFPNIHRCRINQYLTRYYRGQRPTFQRAMKLTIVVGQFFGLNPVLGVCDKDTSKLGFAYFSGRCMYTLVVILGQVIILNGLFFWNYYIKTSTSVTSNSTLMFFASNTIATISFLRIAKQWPKLCQYISKLEVTDPPTDSALVNKCNISCILILTLAVLEHCLSEFSRLVAATDCFPDNIYEKFITQRFPWIKEQMYYTIPLGLISQLLNIMCTFNWNYGDIFIITISIYLTSRLEQINKRISDVRGKYISSTFWRKVREDYNRATNLVRRVDEVICSITFIVFANDFVFICMQLLHTLSNGIKATKSCHVPDERPLKGYEQAVYFVYSFAFLVLRWLTVSLVASQVHTASQKPMAALYDVPSAVYCIEVQRFIKQMNGETVALTGLNFFKVKRGLVLAITGTIVTYELVLIQFTGITKIAPLYYTRVHNLNEIVNSTVYLN